MEKIGDVILKDKEKRETSQGRLHQLDSITLLYPLDTTRHPHSQDHLFKGIPLLLDAKGPLHHPIRGQSPRLYDALLLHILHILCLHLRESRAPQDIALQCERKEGTITNAPRSLMIGVTKGGKIQEAKETEKRT